MAPCKGFVCVLELHIRTVTCPGVALKSRDDVYISACIFGQHKKTSCVRAIFPLIFDEKLMFEKVYTDVVDPGDLVELFETDASVLELIQTVPPVGEILARYEENTRDFLFPAPKFIHQQQSSVREVLMKKAYGFTGIAPKLKFYTTCVISESLLSSAKAQKQVEQLTPSPDVHTWCCPKENKDEAAYDPSLLGSYRPKNTKVIGSHREKDFDSFHDSYNEHLITKMSGRQVHSNLLMHSAPPSLQKYSSTPVLNRSSLRERFHTGLNTSLNGDEIHKRVKNILRTHSARQRLTFDETWLSKEEFAKIRDSSRTGDCKKRGVSRTDSLISNVQSSSSIQPNVMVHLDNGEYWTSQVAEYKNKPHRAIFEDSLEKIYRNMYRKASSSLSKNK
ncbi:spermatogenesis-associated protein 6 isoform X3 [Python bivittatus]|uniref:Spermatogenesis-associated protein 6 isoform X3 n=1 Tax=Python bivittatus TaxID=176946 RepID=A0A9F5IQJ5_PYTBI|nr:spermatogenesis-associated protein 6 isoform X3 [Python bivittatus]